MNVYFTRKKIQSLTAAILVFGVLFLLPQLLFAQAAAAGEKNWIMSGLQGLLHTIVNVVFGTLAGLAGLLLNHAVTTYVVGFGHLYATSGLGHTIDNLWSTVRDIFNLTFIFGLVYIGFKMILNTGDSSAKRMLASLVLAALLVNFSLFITKFIIDFSNIVAAQFAAGFNNAGTYAVSDGFMNLMGISGIFGTGVSLANMSTGAGFAHIFGSLILFVVAAFVFAAGGILLIIRFVVLNIYMILSPLMFLGMVFPGFSNVSKEYWSGFLSRAFFAPAYILMLYFAHQVLANMQGVSAGTAQMAQVFGSANPIPNFASTIPYFILTAVFMIAALVVAQKMGAQGATSAMALGTRMAGGAKKLVGGATLGATAVAGQRTVGYGAHKLSNNKKLQGWAAKSKWGERALKGTRAVADTSFDARQVAGFGAAAGIGTGVNGGFTSRIDAKNKADADFAKSLGETKVEKDRNGNYLDPEIKDKVVKNLEEINADPNSEVNITKQIEAEAQKRVAGITNDLNLAKASAASDQQKYSAEIQRLESSKKSAPSQAEKDKIDVDIAKAKDALAKSGSAVTALQKDFDNAVRVAGTATQNVKKANEEAVEAAESRVTFEKQLAFIHRQEQSAAKWRSVPAKLTGAVTGGAGALIAGAAATPAVMAFAAGAPLVSSFGAQNQESADNLRKTYGTDGTVRKKKKEQEGNMRILAEQMKKLDD